MAVHAHIGDCMFATIPSNKLIEQRIFFISHKYLVPKSSDAYGRVEAIPTPSLQSPEWPTPDQWALACLKRKILQDFQASLKFGKAARSVGLSWHCPIHLFVHAFCTLPLVETPTMIICKAVGVEAMDTILGAHWGYVEGMHDGDHYKCIVSPAQLCLRYLKVRCTLYARFTYERWMRKRGKWIPLQLSTEDVPSFEVRVCMPNHDIEVVTVNSHWTLANLREHLLIMGFEDVNTARFKLQQRKVWL